MCVRDHLVFHLLSGKGICKQAQHENTLPTVLPERSFLVKTVHVKFLPLDYTLSC